MPVIQIRGTSGSGKTWVMRQVMNRLGNWSPVFTAGRRNPLYYVGGNLMTDEKICVLGHYEATCGGCDNIGSARAVYELIREVHDGNGDVPILCEGLLLSEDTKWTKLLEKDMGNGDCTKVHCFFLTTPLATCLSQISKRRQEVGNEKPLNPKNTTNRVQVIERARVKLLEIGVDCRRVSAPQAVNQILKLLGRS